MFIETPANQKTFDSGSSRILPHKQLSGFETCDSAGIVGFVWEHHFYKPINSKGFKIIKNYNSESMISKDINNVG
jgi:hypothetical protein